MWQRLRRRGPRSHLALLRHSVAKSCRTLPGTSPGESGDIVSESLSHIESQDVNTNNSRCTSVREGQNSKREVVQIYSVNIQCLSAHLAELTFQLQLHRPHVVLIQETWLTKLTKDVEIEGYSYVSRRDRHDNDNRGGIITFQRDDFNGLVHIANSESDERSWHFLRLGVETILLANWYRPGASIHDNYQQLYSETA